MTQAMKHVSIEGKLNSLHPFYLDRQEHSKQPRLWPNITTRVALEGKLGYFHPPPHPLGFLSDYLVRGEWVGDFRNLGHVILAAILD